MRNEPGKTYYEYKIKNGDTFSGIVHRMFGHTLNDSRYAESVNYLLALNPQIVNPNRIRAGDMLRLGTLPATPQPTKLPHPARATENLRLLLPNQSTLTIWRGFGHSPGLSIMQIT